MRALTATSVSIRVRSGALARPVAFLGRAGGPAVAALGATGLLVWMAFDAGGYFPSSFVRVGAIAWGLCALLLVLRPPEHALTGPALAGLGALAGLAVWTGVSSSWSLDQPAGIEDMQRCLLYTGLFGLGLLAAASGRYGGRVAWLLGAAGLAVVIAALVDRMLIPGVDVPGGTGYRLQFPLTYWNTLGALASMTAILAGGLAADRRAAMAARGACASAAVLAVVAMYLTLSRGAWLALGVGLVVLLVFSPRRAGVLATLIIAGAAVTAALLRLRAYPELVTDPALGIGRLRGGRQFAPQLLGLALGAGGVQMLAAIAGRRFRDVRARSRRRRRQMAAAGAILALGAAGLGAGLLAGSSPGDYLNRQWHDFQQASNERSGTARLTTAGGSRSQVYTVALDGFRAHPVAGDGAGSFRARWARDRPVDGYVTNAHSLYLETLSDMGVVGLLLVLAFIGAVVFAGARAIRRPAGMTAAEAAAVVAAFAVWAAHAGVDWDWQMSSMTGIAIVLAATLFAEQRRTSQRRRRGLPRGAGFRVLGIACVALAAYLGLAGRDAVRVREATRLVQRGDYAAAARHASQVHDGPAGTEASIVEAFAARGRGDLAGAERAFAKAVNAEPNDWSLRSVRAQNLLLLGDDTAAQREMDRAVALNPRLQLPAGFAR